jgi:hypothetical protein
LALKNGEIRAKTQLLGKAEGKVMTKGEEVMVTCPHFTIRPPGRKLCPDVPVEGSWFDVI